MADRRNRIRTVRSKGVLLEETPKLDTYETRQRIRIAVGAALCAFMFLSAWFTYRVFSPRPAPDEMAIPPQMAVAGAAGPLNVRETPEREARVMLDRAREDDKNRKTELAVAMLKKVVTSYPTTAAGVQAKDALARKVRGMPLFGPALLADSGEPKKPEPPEPKKETKVVEATKTEVASASGGNASLVLPSNAPPGQPVGPPGQPVPGPGGPAAGAGPGPAPGAGPDTHPPAQPDYTALPPGFHHRPGIAANPSGWPLEIYGDRDPDPMVLVTGATFIQGRDDGEPFEGPAHQVILPTFYIDQHEVTVRQFNLFQKEMGRRAERDRAVLKQSGVADASEDTPVVMVNARDASDYAKWAAKQLPTEAQWEAAARTPDARLFPWGKNPLTGAPPRNNRVMAPVLSFRTDVSLYGAYDLSGNAWEWTKDFYEARYYNQFRNMPADNPDGPPPPKSQQLVVKGTAKDGVVTRREGHKPETRLPYLSFRCVLVVEGPGNAFEPRPKPGEPARGQPTKGQNQLGGAPVPF